MSKKSNTVLSLEMALKAAIYTSEEQSIISRIAEKNGWNITTLRNSLCPTTQTHKANIYHLEAVLSETKDFRIMDSLCAIHGNAAWFELPQVIEDLDHASYITKIGELAQEQGHLSQSVALAISDGRITQQEHDEIYKEVFDLFRVTATLLAMVKNQKERDHG
ncbi:phage regulatory CII family protein [Acinetobacter bereziniae]|uniref:phage regulatory CII family protein n=1 Tax=Acinetobacter bereziniae TaxID=106648 RepID=UPI00066910FC|nr:phage regulatory CII family protein [Acinetobacter bereziniae]